MIASAFGLSNPRGVAGRDDALDRKAVAAQVAQPRRLVLGLERRDADEVVAGVVEALAGLDRAVDGRDRRPELVVEMAPEVGPAGLVEALDLPAIHRPVGQRVALGRGGAEGAPPGAGVAEVEIEQHAVGVEGDQGPGHARTLAKCVLRDCRLPDDRIR